VLVGIIDAAPEPAVLLTVRAQGLRRHAGQIAFPGGRMDAGDRDMVDTALREAREETGLAPGTVQVVGFLPEQAIISGYRVTPVVARLESLPPLTPDPVEVAECFLLPWRHVMDDRHHVPAERPASHGTSRPYDILYGERRIWGATARILQSLREQALAPTPRSAGT
jgi:8-oxo-dGTP pyrophosphatase MutT (NUDIX family)